jgi:hypothetical protein
MVVHLFFPGRCFVPRGEWFGHPLGDIAWHLARLVVVVVVVVDDDAFVFSCCLLMFVMIKIIIFVVVLRLSICLFS